MKQIFLACLAIGVLLGGTVVTATADDIQPPSWRGADRTTSQMWEFYANTPGVPILPDGPAPGGLPPLPSTHLIVYPLGDWIPYDPPSGREGIWPLSGEIRVTVDNFPDLWEKTMWVQVTWQPQVGSPDAVPVFSGYEMPGYDVTMPTLFGEAVPLGNGWYESTYQWFIHPNPPDEYFTIGGNINVDELVVDTICTPEPSTLILLGVGALALAIGRWRKRA